MDETLLKIMDLELDQLKKGYDPTKSAADCESIALSVFQGSDLAKREEVYWQVDKFDEHVNYFWPLKMLCQYTRPIYNLGDKLWYRPLINIISSRKLFYKSFPLRYHAFPDKQIDSNIANISGIVDEVKTDKHFNSDGVWYRKNPLVFNQFDGEETIEIENPFGIVEFGTQKLCKSVHTLVNKRILLRVPYNGMYEGTQFDPVAVFFYVKP